MEQKAFCLLYNCSLEQLSLINLNLIYKKERSVKQKNQFLIIITEDHNYSLWEDCQCFSNHHELFNMCCT